MRWAANADKGQRAIATALEAVGATVEYIAPRRKGPPDMLVGYRLRNYLLEAKAPKGPRGGDSRDGQHLSKEQEEWHAKWRGQSCVVRTPEEALAVIGATRAA